MGLFSKKKKTQTELLSERLEVMMGDKQQTLSTFYLSEMAQEDEIKEKIAHPPKEIWKKNRYKKRRQSELEELKAKHDQLFHREGMAEAQGASEKVNQELNEKKEGKGYVSISDIEEVFQSKEIYDAKELVEVKALLPPTERYNSCQKALEFYKKEEGEKPELDEKTKASVDASLTSILGEGVDLDNAREFVEKEHPELHKLLNYKALLESIEQEVEIMIRKPEAKLMGLKKSEYAKLYGQRLTADVLVARALLQQENLLQEYREYQEKKARGEEKRAREEEEKRAKEEAKEKERAKKAYPYRTIYDKMKDVEIGDTFLPDKCAMAKNFKFIYDKLKSYLESKIINPDKDLDNDWKIIRQSMRKCALFGKMGPISDITTFSLPLIKKTEFGVDFLKKTDESLFLAYAVQTVAESFAEAMKEVPKHAPWIDKNDVKDIKAKTEKLKQKLNLDKEYKDRIEKAKKDFKTERHIGIEESWQQYPECFAYYQFMNDEVVKTNQYLKGNREKPGLFETADFNVFDSNDPKVLKGYLETYKKQYMEKENHDPMYDEIYEYLEKHVNYRVEAQTRLKKIAENGSVEEYKKGKTWEVDEKKGSYLLKGFETTKQNTGQGCWSVALAAMLQYRGFKVDQTDIRSHRFEADTKVNYDSSYYQNMNGALNIAYHFNLIAELAPDTMMKQLFIGVLPKNPELKKKIQDLAKEAIGKSHGPLAVLFKGHYRVIYGCDGENVTMHDPLEETVRTWSLDDLVSQMKGARDLSFYWLADLPELNEEGERVLEVENKDLEIRYNREGVLEYQGRDEYEDPGLSIVRNGYAQFCTGGDEWSRVEYTFLPAKEKHNLGKDK